MSFLCMVLSHNQNMPTMLASSAANSLLPELSSATASISPRTPHSSAPWKRAAQKHHFLSMGKVICSAESAKCHSLVLDHDSSDVGIHDSPKLYSHLSSLLPVANSERQQTMGILPALSFDQQLGQYSIFTGNLEGELYSDWITRQFAAAVQSSPTPKQKQESSERDDFYANMGSAIRTLREEMPSVFCKDLTYNIYRDDITFKSPRNTFAGIDNYKLIFWALRFHGRIFFKAIWVDVVRVWQRSERVIVVRWTVRGIPRVPWEAQGSFDGTSEYKLDKEGKIYEHKVDNVALNYPPKFRTPTVLDLLTSAGCATPTPTFFERHVLPSQLALPYLQISTWERFYWALTTTLDIQNGKSWWSWYVAL